MLFTIDDKKLEIPDAARALPGRSQAMPVDNVHFVNSNPIKEPVPAHLRKAVFGLGCFWGAERLFWQLPGVFSTAVGYAGGFTPNPSYQEVCSGQTGHTEAVLVFYAPDVIDYETLLSTFWEAHDPTQGMRQGNDAGTQYRSAIYTLSARQQREADASRDRFQAALSARGYEKITTEIKELTNFYYAEDYHQQYLAKNPNGYCGLAGTGTCYVPKRTPAP